MIFEEKYLKQAHLPALIVIGFEGVFGFLMCACVVLPVVSSIDGDDCGQYENVLDALKMLRQDAFLLVMFLMYYLSISFYNGLGLTVCDISLYTLSNLTCLIILILISLYISLYLFIVYLLQVAKLLSSVHRTLIDACRSIVVWVVMIIIYYSTDHEYGESWGTYSYIQVLGFVVLACGTLIFNHVVPIEKLWEKKGSNEENESLTGSGNQRGYGAVEEPTNDSHDEPAPGKQSPPINGD